LKDIICYISSENPSHSPTLEQKMLRGRTEATLFRPGKVPVTVLVLLLVIDDMRPLTTIYQ